MSNRKIELNKPRRFAYPPCAAQTDDALRAWLQEQAVQLLPAAKDGDNAAPPVPADATTGIFLLSHHDDGIVWGRIYATADGYELKTSDFSGSPSPDFRLKTLQECRLFSERGELFLWRQDGKLKTRLVLDEDSEGTEKCDYYNEKQVLWGVYRDGNLSTDDFTVVFEGQGLRHAVPLKTTDADFSKDSDEENKRLRPLRLTARHYLAYDKDGCAYVALSRLVALDKEAVATDSKAA
jgi:CRISPR-associated protein (TIGR03984 family)